jgi:hypothetical protein
MLVIRQTQRNHSEIARLLNDLGEIADQNAVKRPAKDAVVSVKVYATGDQPPDKVASVIQEFVEPRSWSPTGDGVVETLKGSLVVKQTAQVHRAIQRFLSQLDLKTSQTLSISASKAVATAMPKTRGTDPFAVPQSSDGSKRNPAHAKR